MEKVESLIELGNMIGFHLERLWLDSATRPLVARAAAKYNQVPTVCTNLDPSGLNHSVEFREWVSAELRPAPGQKIGRRGRRVQNDTSTPKGSLNREVMRFVEGVLTPGRLRYMPAGGRPGTDDKDVITASKRKALFTASRAGRFGGWASAFVEQYIKPFRPDLLSVGTGSIKSSGAISGAWASMVEKRQLARAKANNEKNPWGALKLLAADSLRMHKTLINKAVA